MGVRVLTIIGTRPEAIKLFPVVHALAADPRFESRVCVTGQHREMVDDILSLAAVRPDYDLNLMQPAQTLEAVTAGVLTACTGVVDTEQPDWIIVQGDTTSALAGALAAHYRGVPVCHVEAGLRSGCLSNPWPEEANRRMISVLANLHCAPTETAAQALRNENIAPSAVRVTGNTGIDALMWVRERLAGEPERSTQRVQGIRRWAADRRIVTVTLHRREIRGPALAAIADAIVSLASRGDAAFVVSVHPHPVVQQTLRTKMSGNGAIKMVDALGYPDFIALLSASSLVLTDSGGIQEEAPALGVPVLVLRNRTERPEGLDSGRALLVGTEPGQIIREVASLLDNEAVMSEMATAGLLYGDGSASSRVSEFILQRS